MQNEQFSKEQIQMVGNYAAYLHNIGEAIGKFASIDVLALARAALEVSELQEALKLANDQTERTRDAMQGQIDGLAKGIAERNHKIDEMRGDVRNAEAHSDELDSKFKAAVIRCKEVESARDTFKAAAKERFEALENIYSLFSIPEGATYIDAHETLKAQLADLKLRGDNQSAACQFWYDAWNDVRAALDVDTEGLADNEKVDAVAEAAKQIYRSIIPLEKFTKILDALQLSHDLTFPQAVEHARQIRHAADSHAEQENEWRRRYDELCNVMGFDGVDHDATLCEARDAKAAESKANKQVNYQRKYNELKGSLGLAGMPHDEAVNLARKNPIR